jgi:hypothetical protein
MPPRGSWRRAIVVKRRKEVKATKKITPTALEGEGQVRICNRFPP